MMEQQQEHQQQQLPLSWSEARSRLRLTLEGWNSERKRQQRENNGGDVKTDDVVGGGGTASPSCWVDDPDMMFLAIPLSFLFVALSFALPTSNSDYDSSFRGRQRAAALLFLVSSATSAWIARRRRKVSRETDGSIERRRCVSAFLDGMKSSRGGRLCGSSEQQTSGGGGQPRKQGSQRTIDPRHEWCNVDTIPRKNVEDVYSTYRLIDCASEGGDESSNDGRGDGCQGRGQGHWHRIPSLLLVKGDFVALKVGDTAPTKCKVVKTSNEKNDSDNDDGNPVIEAGERLTVDSLTPSVRDTLTLSRTSAKNKKSSLLPPGRSTLKYHSEEMLLLANGVRIFVLLETPLDSFLRKEDGERRGSTPQALRRGEAVRRTLLPLSVAVFAATLFVLLVRPGGAGNFFRTTAWTLPLLASLGVLPVTSPLLLFWIECVGTSRILATVHPLASNQKQQQTIEPMGMLGDSSRRQSSVLSLDERSSLEVGGRIEKPSPWLLCRYLMATASSRLFTKSLLEKISSMRSSEKPASSLGGWDALLSVPPASLYLLEKMGVVTAFALVDDELACDPHSTPQQLLIPSGQGGFSLLDICPVFDEEDVCSTDDEDNNNDESRNNDGNDDALRRSDDNSIDSDDSNEEMRVRFNHSFSAPARRTLRKIRSNYGRRKRSQRSLSFQQSDGSGGVRLAGNSDDDDDDGMEVQFEDPQWWKHLPSLKCIGLGCLLAEERTTPGRAKTMPLSSSTPSGGGGDNVQNPALSNPSLKVSFEVGKSPSGRPYNAQKPPPLTSTETSLVDHICHDERERKQLRLLAQCIGFDTSPGPGSPRGDLSCFSERRRLHVVSADLLRQRMQLNTHALGLEESRNWSRLFTDADTVFVRDARSGGDLVLTVGDSRIVTQLCPDWWQGENSTISPLTAADRHIINETQKNWMLSDMDVQAFSYAPLPYTADQKIELGGGTRGSHIYLLDNATPNAYIPSHGFWSLVKNQIFLGLLGSSVRPRKEIEPLVESCAAAGVRFVYFSPRNMRRTKELASQMGIDVAWNCAISLRPLEEGTDDSFRMIGYEDWDVNARLPHGVDDVRRHLEEVDNVPLLVSLYTDVTKKTAADMVNVFQEYNDTVLSVGLSHLPGNQEIFSRADIAIGVDVLAEGVSFNNPDSNIHALNALQPHEIAFVTSISAHSSVFNLHRLATRHFAEIIRIGRVCLEAATSGASFALSGNLSFSIFVLLCPCTAATAVPTLPALGSFLYTQVLLPTIGLSMVLTDDAQEFMTRVPPKNDPSVKYSPRADRRLYLSGLIRAVVPAIIPQFLYLIALGDLMLEFDSPFVKDFCLPYLGGDEVEYRKPPITFVIRCEAMRDYSGPATESAGTISMAALAICTCVASASYVFRMESILSEPPWKRNHLWLGTLALAFLLVTVYMSLVLEPGSMVALSWYFYLLFLMAPFACLYFCEAVKTMDQRHEKRAIMMRRLQFETRLGMWSPKESTHMGDVQNNNQKENVSPIV